MRAITKPECLMSKSLFYKSFPGRNIIRKIASWFSSYMETFSKKLMDHFENEYEVQFRSGKITEVGELTLINFLPIEKFHPLVSLLSSRALCFNAASARKV